MKNQKQITAEKYLNVLKYLAKRKRGFNDIRSILSMFSVSVAMQKVLTDRNLIVKDDNGIWKWSSKMPDELMAYQVLNDVNQGIRNANKSVKKRPIEASDIFSPSTGNKLSTGKNFKYIKPKTIKPTAMNPIQSKQNKRQKSEDKYLNFLEFLYKRNRGFKSFSKIISKHKMCSSISSILKQNNLMDRQDGIWYWIGRTPDITMAAKVLHDVNQSIIDSVANKNKNNSPVAKNGLNEFKKFMNKVKSNKPKVVVHKYIPTAGDGLKRSDILNLVELRNEREKLQSRVNAIDNLLITIDILKKK